MILFLTLVERQAIPVPEPNHFALSIICVHILAGVCWASSTLRRGGRPASTLYTALLLGPLSFGLGPIFWYANDPQRAQANLMSEKILWTSRFLSLLIAVSLWGTYLQAGLLDSLVTNFAVHLQCKSESLIVPLIFWSGLQFLALLVSRRLRYLKKG